MNLIGPPPIAVANIFAKRGNFHYAGFLRPNDRHHTERRTNRQRLAAMAKNGLNFLRRGIRRHIIVARRKSEQLIAHTPARKERLIPMCVQLFHHLQGEMSLCIRGSRHVRIAAGK